MGTMRTPIHTASYARKMTNRHQHRCHNLKIFHRYTRCLVSSSHHNSSGYVFF